MSEAERLKREWEQRAASAEHRFYIASHPRWENDAAWESVGKADASFVLTGLSEEVLKPAQVLEIGCGMGRLTPYIAPNVAGYTGIDVSPTFLEKARERCRHLPNTRWFEGDGSSIPEPAKDRQYDLVFSAAVLIHVPKEIAAAYCAEVRDVLRRPGGLFRFQVLADPEDTGGYSADAAEAVVVDHEIARANAELEAQFEATRPAALIGEGYIGHAFGWDEATEFFRDALGPEVQLLRMNRAFICGQWTRPAVR